jgi:hypothetical protein
MRLWREDPSPRYYTHYNNVKMTGENVLCNSLHRCPCGYLMDPQRRCGCLHNRSSTLMPRCPFSTLVRGIVKLMLTAQHFLVSVG